MRDPTINTQAIETNPAARPTGTWGLFLTVHAVLVSVIETRLKEARLPPLTWYDVLWALERAPTHKLRMFELAEEVVLSRFNLSRLVDKLEAAGLVSRERTEEDGRGAFAVLTRSGIAMRKKMWPLYYSAIDELFLKHLTAQEEVILQQALRRIRKAAG
jgi:DNA-binding MarR family transcriptional regulator